MTTINNLEESSCSIVELFWCDSGTYRRIQLQDNRDARALSSFFSFIGSTKPLECWDCFPIHSTIRHDLVVGSSVVEPLLDDKEDKATGVAEAGVSPPVTPSEPFFVAISSFSSLLLMAFLGWSEDE